MQNFISAGELSPVTPPCATSIFKTQCDVKSFKLTELLNVLNISNIFHSIFRILSYFAMYKYNCILKRKLKLSSKISCSHIKNKE